MASKRQQKFLKTKRLVLLLDSEHRRQMSPTITMVNSAEIITHDNVMQSSEEKTPDGKLIWEKSPVKMEADVEAFVKHREEECPKRERRHDKIRKLWANRGKLLY